jgi:retron-type reverse transcriptase
VPTNLERVNEAAKRDKRARFTALLHHVDVVALERAFRRVKRKAAPGVDGETVESYEENLAERLRDLCDRVHRGSYGHSRYGGSTFPKPTAVSGLSVCRRSRTRSSKAQWPRC